MKEYYKMKDCFQKHTDAMYNMYLDIKKDLVSFMKSNNINIVDVQACHTESDKIFALLFIDGEVKEYEIIAMKLTDEDDIELLVQPSYYNVNVEWSMNDIIESTKRDKDVFLSDSFWEAFDCTGELLPVFTAYNIADAIRYIDFNKSGLIN